MFTYYGVSFHFSGFWTPRVPYNWPFIASKTFGVSLYELMPSGRRSGKGSKATGLGDRKDMVALIERKREEKRKNWPKSVPSAESPTEWKKEKYIDEKEGYNFLGFVSKDNIVIKFLPSFRPSWCLGRCM